MTDDATTPPPGPPTEVPLGPPTGTAPPSRPRHAERRTSSLAFGSRALTFATGVVLLVTAFTAGVLGYRDHRDETTTQTAGTATTSAPTSAPAQAPPTTCKEPSDIPTAPGKPTDIAVPDKPVTAMRIRDLREGKGPAVESDEQLTLQYVGISCASGKQFDSTWDRNEPLSVRLDRGNVIPGWDQGIKGMKVGGRRLLWIPASLAYGDTGRPPDIGPGDTLIFVIDLEKIAD